MPSTSSVTREQVRLIKDIPELSLRRGDVGVARMIGESTVPVYEAQFGGGDPTRPKCVLLLFGDQLEVLSAPQGFHGGKFPDL